MVRRVRADRLLSLLLLLQARGRMTAAALATELEVSIRTIYRDLDALSAAGVPVYAEPGHGGGYQLLAGYRTPLTGLSAEEAAALLILGVPQPLRDLGLGPSMQAAHRRVRAAAGMAGDDGPHVHLDMPRWFHTQEATPHLPTLADAISRRRRLVITYRDSRSHDLEPLGLVNKAGVWYLVAGLAAERTAVFRVARITSVDVVDAAFERPAAFDLVAFWEARSADFEASRPRVEVMVRASPRALSVMPEVFGEAVRPGLEAAGAPDPAGWRRVTLTFESVEAAAHRLAGFGGLVEVEWPLGVRERLVATAQATLDVHGEGDRPRS